MDLRLNLKSGWYGEIDETHSDSGDESPHPQAISALSSGCSSPLYDHHRKTSPVGSPSTSGNTSPLYSTSPPPLFSNEEILKTILFKLKVLQSTPTSYNVEPQEESEEETYSSTTDTKDSKSSNLEEEQSIGLSELEVKARLETLCSLFPPCYELDKDKLLQLSTALIGNSSYDYEEFINDYTDEVIAADAHFLRGKSNKYRVNVEKLSESTTMAKSPTYLRAQNLDCLPSAPKTLRSLSLECDEINPSAFTLIKKFKDLEVLLIFFETRRVATTPLVNIPYYLFSRLKHLLILDLSRVPIAELPSSVGLAKELRYLDLSYTLIELLPDTIDCLDKLQTLRLGGCFRLRELPEGITKLRSLQHLDLQGLSHLSFLPKGIGMLTNLATLSTFPVNKHDGSCISELKKMDKLRGRLSISHLEKVSNVEEVVEAALNRKTNITELELSWDNAPNSLRDVRVQLHDCLVLTQLHPPFTLEHLEVSGYPGIRLPLWFSAPDISLSNVSSFTLVNFDNLHDLPCLGQSRSLRVLKLIGMKRIKKINQEWYQDTVAFPALEQLVIVGFPKLVTWESAQGSFPCLRMLTIDQCPKLTGIPPLSSFGSLQLLEISHCTKLSRLSLDQRHLPRSLHKIVVENCPLIGRYNEMHGKDRFMIQPMQNVSMDSETESKFRIKKSSISNYFLKTEPNERRTFKYYSPVSRNLSSSTKTNDVQRKMMYDIPSSTGATTKSNIGEVS